MITQFAITLIERRLANPEWPTLEFMVAGYVPRYREAWRRAAIEMLMDGLWRFVNYNHAAGMYEVLFVPAPGYFYRHIPS